jgi:hypothetical protein
MSDTLQFVVVKGEGLAAMLLGSFATIGSLVQTARIDLEQRFISTIRGSGWPLVNVRAFRTRHELARVTDTATGADPRNHTN